VVDDITQFWEINSGEEIKYKMHGNILL